MNKKENYHIYTHTDPSISDLGSFVSETESLGVGLNIVDMLNYQDENGNYNLDNLIARYSVSEVNKFNSTIELIKSYRVNSITTTPSNLSGTNNLTTSKTEIAVSKNISVENYVKPKNSATLQNIFKKDLTFVNHAITRSNKRLLDELFNDDVKLLFQKFIYLVETTTDYSVEINNSVRSLNEQRQQIKKGNSKSEFSYHMVGLAIDVRLRHNTDSALDLNKSSDPKLWVAAKIIDISNKLQLKWGGTFGDVENDVVHFDCRNFFIVNQNGYIQAIKNPEEKTTNDPATTVNESGETEVDNSSFSDLPIKIGTVLNISVYKVDRTVLTTETNQVISSIDYESFLAKELVRLLSDVGYKRVFAPNPGKESKGTVQEMYPHISVWVWSRALSIKDIQPVSEKTVYEHKIINITPYITSVNTNVGENGGSFNITVAPVVGQLKNVAGGKVWDLKEGSQKDSKNPNNKYHINSGHVHYVQDNELKRNNMFLEKALQANDIVFIKFEKLDVEVDRDSLNEIDFISTNKLPDQIFDMMGLIDNTTVSTSFQSLDCNISITGRDFVKLLIEDGVYFYASQFTDSGIFANTGATNNRLLRFNGQIKNRFQESNKSIEKSLKFLMNNLGEIEICPSSLFDSYGSVRLNKDSDVVVDKRSSFNQLIDKDSEEQKSQLQKIEDKKQNIIKNLERIIKNNNLDETMKVSVYNTINSFLSQLIDTNSIVSEGQKIKYWDYTIAGIIYKNRLPDSLDLKFVVFDKTWSKDNNKSIGNINQYSIITDLQDLFDKSDRVEIINNNLLNFDNIYRSNSTRKYQLDNISKFIPVKSIVYELDSYVNSAIENDIFDDANTDSLFNKSEIEKIKDDYSNVTSQGHSLFLNIVSKLFDELNIDEKNIFNDIYNLIIEERSIQKNKNTVEELKPMLGVWQVIKLIIDDSVRDRRIVDPSIGNENGSLLNAIRKICQDPFCEFYTDTYGSQFYFIVRKKPFDRESVLSMLEGRVLYEKYDTNTKQVTQEATRNATSLDKETVNSSLSFIDQKLIIDIEEKDVLSDTLTYSTEAYSWYKLNLANLTQGSQSTMAFAYLRAIYFEEYADIYGSKPLDLTTSYIPYSPILDKNKKLPTAYFIKQAVYDLKYMIETHAYLPFTRTGTITTNGDRRIKRGTFVRLKSTNEIFYVDNVSNSYSIDDGSIDRETVLQVSRGMVEKYITGVNHVNSDGSTIKISYFDICDLKIDKKIFEDVNSSYSAFSEGSLATWKVNKTVFNFFLKKLQFSNE